MALAFKKGDAVRQIVPAPITGIVVESRVSDSDEVICLVEWIDENGSTQARWFTETQIEAVPEA